jgi:phosphatidylglycerol:prolipoprotein diacylglycerol transferase
MCRILVSIGPFNIYSYGVMLALAFIVGTLLAQKRSVKSGVDANKILDLILYLLVSGVVGARALFVIINWDYYKDNFADVIKVWEGGLVFYGGLILALAAGIYYLKRNRLPILKVADILSPSVAIGVAIGRIGCFLNGCCYGKNPNIPTQLFESGWALIMFFILLAIERYKKFDGFLFWLFLLFYSLGRFVIEGIRDYEFNYILWGGLTISQGISVVLGIIALVFLIRGHTT